MLWSDRNTLLLLTARRPKAFADHAAGKPNGWLVGIYVPVPRRLLLHWKPSSSVGWHFGTYNNMFSFVGTAVASLKLSGRPILFSCSRTRYTRIDTWRMLRSWHTNFHSIDPFVGSAGRSRNTLSLPQRQCGSRTQLSAEHSLHALRAKIEGSADFSSPHNRQHGDQ